jgi:hypothetical protein
VGGEKLAQFLFVGAVFVDFKIGSLCLDILEMLQDGLRAL